MNFYLRRTLLPLPLGKALAPAGAGRQLLARVRGEVLLSEQPQDEATARYWPRAGLADIGLDWHEPAETLDRSVRATNPWNRGALTTLRGQPLRLLGVTPHPNAVTGPATPGTVLHADAAAGLWVTCGAREALRLDMVALDEGYFTGLQLLQLGVGVGEVLGSTPLPG